MSNKTTITLEIESNSRNESFARSVVAAFSARLNPTLEEIADIKTAVSEAVTNCIIHAYNSSNDGKIIIKCTVQDNELCIEIKDNGVGIEDVDKAMEPLYTTKPEMERSGMGFTFMESFMNKLEVKSKLGEGTTVIMKKIINGRSYLDDKY